jgi:hypothetical protein
MHDSVYSSQPLLMRFLVRSWEFRHPSAWVAVRMVCGIFNVGLGLLLFSYGYWVGAVPLAGAALIFWTAYRLQQSIQSQPAA